MERRETPERQLEQTLRRIKPVSLSRRSFVGRMATGTALASSPFLAGLACRSEMSPHDGNWTAAPYGPLRPSADSPELDIPEEGFRCVRLSSGGVQSTVRPSLSVPNAFDGMASFPLPNGNVRLIRNHEMFDSPESGAAIGAPHYDVRATGGTTSLEVRISGTGPDLSVELIDEFVSLAGTRVNCAGGPTPWGSWLSCEEITGGRNEGFDRPHGYVFEVPASATGPVEAVPLVGMGRFIHEAVAIDPETGIVYETEDTWYSESRSEFPGAGLYRFLPSQQGDLAAGGRLQMLAVEGRPGYVTARGQTVGTVLPASWVDIDDPDPEHADVDHLAVFKQGAAKGAAVFARLEGAWYGDGGIYVVSTNGGDAESGQLFRYRPQSPSTGELELVFESPGKDVLDSPDNIVVSPRGGLVMCEDGGEDQYIRGLDGEGRVIDLVRNPVRAGGPSPREFAGSCFSPDGRVLFFNVQGSRTVDGGTQSATYALWGPWENGPL